MSSIRNIDVQDIQQVAIETQCAQATEPAADFRILDTYCVLTVAERKQMKQIEIDAIKRTIARRDAWLAIKENKSRPLYNFLAESTNKLRRDLTIAEADMRRIEYGIYY